MNVARAITLEKGVCGGDLAATNCAFAKYNLVSRYTLCFLQMFSSKQVQIVLLPNTIQQAGTHCAFGIKKSLKPGSEREPEAARGLGNCPIVRRTGPKIFLLANINPWIKVIIHPSIHPLDYKHLNAFVSSCKQEKHVTREIPPSPICLPTWRESERFNV